MNRFKGMLRRSSGQLQGTASNWLRVGSSPSIIAFHHSLKTLQKVNTWSHWNQSKFATFLSEGSQPVRKVSTQKRSSLVTDSNALFVRNGWPVASNQPVMWLSLAVIFLWWGLKIPCQKQICEAQARQMVSNEIRSACLSTKKTHHSTWPRLMIICWFGARWFGFVGSCYERDWDS